MAFPEDFFWGGGASAANQYEGAWNKDSRGPNIFDAATAGSATKPRQYHDHIHENIYPLIRQQQTFIIITKKISS